MAPAAAAAVTGTGNWLATGVDAGALAGTVRSASPGFADAGAKDFTLAAGSAAIGVASQSVSGLPDREYYRDESQKAMYRPRASARDIGAFEHATSGPGVGPYGQARPPAARPPLPAPSGGCGNPGEPETAAAALLWVAFRVARDTGREGRHRASRVE